MTRYGDRHAAESTSGIMSVMPTVSLSELQGAVEWVSNDDWDSEAYVCRLTGRLVWVPGKPGILDEEDEIPDDIDDVAKYIPVPHPHDLDLGTRLVFSFAAEHLADQYDEVREIFHSKGAYRRFKALLEHRGVLENWYAYSDERTLNALQEWCKSERLTFEE